MASECIFKFPVINLSKENTNPDTDSWIEACNFVRRALEEYGFFLAVHDNFSAEYGGSIFKVLQDLFRLPTEIKAQNISETPFVGYFESKSPDNLHESTSIQDATNLKAIQSFIHRMWSSVNNDFCEIIYSHVKKAAELDGIVSRMVFASYGVEQFHRSHLESLNYILRMIRYESPNLSETNFGAKAHTDKNFLTVLHQNGINGLDVQLRNGNWIDVDFPPSSVVILAGNALSGWSNGRVHSPVHRVINKGTEPRYSAAQFSYVAGTIQTPAELVDDEHPLLYKPFNNFGLLHFFITEEGRRAHDLLKAYCGV